MKLKGKLFWNFFIRIYFTCLLKLGITSVGSILLTRGSNTGPVVILVVLVVLIIVFTHIIYSNKAKLYLPSKKMRFGSLYLRVRTEGFGPYYMLVFALRRAVFILLTYSLIEQPHLIVQFFILSNIGYLIYFWHSWPVQDNLGNRIEIVNEVLF